MDDISYIKELQPDKRNARKHSPRNLGMIEKSLQEVGAARSIVVDEDNNILAGNGTIEAAGNVGIEKVRFVETDGNEIIAVKRKGLTEEQKKKLALYDNRTADLAEWNAEVLAELDKEIDLSGMFSEKELGEITHLTPEVIEDEVPEPPKEAKTRPGDLYELGRHRLLCGDSTDSDAVARLMEGEKANMVCTDPPFEMAEMEYMSVMLMMCDGAVLVMHSDKNMVRLASRFIDQFHYFLCHYYSFGFARSANMPQMAHHLIGVFGAPRFHSEDGFKTVIEEQLEHHKLMPYQKRTGIFEKIIQHYSAPDDIVLDGFGGSGSVLIASETSGRRCRTMELNPAYCDVIVARWEAFTGDHAALVPRETGRYTSDYDNQPEGKAASHA